MTDSWTAEDKTPLLKLHTYLKQLNKMRPSHIQSFVGYWCHSTISQSHTMDGKGQVYFLTTQMLPEIHRWYLRSTDTLDLTKQNSLWNSTCEQKGGM